MGRAASPNDLEVVNPATEEPCAVISLGTVADVDRAVAAARGAFQTYSQASVADRLGLLRALQEIYDRRYDEVAATISMEMGAPIDMSKRAKATAGKRHIATVIETLNASSGNSRTRRARPSSGWNRSASCAMITPWRWPINQITGAATPAPRPAAPRC